MGQWWCWAYCREYTAYPIGQAQPKWTINLWLIVPHYRKYIYYMGSFHITQWFCYSKHRFSFQSGIHLTQMSKLQMTAIHQGKITSSDIKCLWNKKNAATPYLKKRNMHPRICIQYKTTCITKREQQTKNESHFPLPAIRRPSRCTLPVGTPPRWRTAKMRITVGRAYSGLPKHDGF